MPLIVPPLLKNHSLLQLIAWYEKNLVDVELLDKRQHRVIFDLSRFAYLVKLNELDGTKLVNKVGKTFTENTGGKRWVSY